MVNETEKQFESCFNDFLSYFCEQPSDKEAFDKILNTVIVFNTNFNKWLEMKKKEKKNSSKKRNKMRVNLNVG